MSVRPPLPYAIVLGTRATGGDCPRVREEDSEDPGPGDRLGHKAEEGGGTMTSMRDLHAGWMKDPAYRREYEALEPAFAPVAALIRVRV